MQILLNSNLSKKKAMVKITPGKNPSGLWFQVRDKQQKKLRENKKKQNEASKEEQDKAIKTIMDLWNEQKYNELPIEHQTFWEGMRQKIVVRKQKPSKKDLTLIKKAVAALQKK